MITISARIEWSITFEQIVQFKAGAGWQELGLTDDEQVTIHGVDKIEPRGHTKATIAS